MQNENTSTQMRKGTLEFCILLVISRGEVYTSDLIDELKAARFIVVEGTLYPLLNRLQKSGYLDYTWKESPSGPPRKYYRLTPAGTDFLAALQSTWMELSASIDLILSKTQNQTGHE
jgi:PadR family transcriptional regulator PadR